VQQELIAEIRRNSICSLIVTADGNISNPNKRHFKDRNGSYIILTPDGNIKSLKAEINGLADGRDKFTRLWISKALFLWLEQMNSQCRDKETFFLTRICNCIIIIKSMK
jgi:hypothetical protein